MARERETQGGCVGESVGSFCGGAREGKQVVAYVGHSVKNTTDHVAASKKSIQARELAAQVLPPM